MHKNFQLQNRKLCFSCAIGFSVLSKVDFLKIFNPNSTRKSYIVKQSFKASFLQRSKKEVVLPRQNRKMLNMRNGQKLEQNFKMQSAYFHLLHYCRILL